MLKLSILFSIRSFLLSAETIISPAFKPCKSAGEPLNTVVIKIPLSEIRKYLSLRAVSFFWYLIPIKLSLEKHKVVWKKKNK